MKVLDILIDRTLAVSRVSVWFAGAFMLATAVMVGAEIIARKLGSAAVTGASEVGGYMLAICSVWAFSFTLLTRSNIRFDVLYARCGPRTRAVMDLLGLLALGVFVFTVSYHAFAVLRTSISFQARSVSSLAVPLWLPQSLWFAGLAFLCWTITVLALRVCVALLRGDFATVRRLAGIPDAEEVVEEEVAELTDDTAVGSR